MSVVVDRALSVFPYYSTAMSVSRNTDRGDSFSEMTVQKLLFQTENGGVSGSNDVIQNEFTAQPAGELRRNEYAELVSLDMFSTFTNDSHGSDPGIFGGEVSVGLNMSADESLLDNDNANAGLGEVIRNDTTTSDSNVVQSAETVNTGEIFTTRNWMTYVNDASNGIGAHDKVHDRVSINFRQEYGEGWFATAEDDLTARHQGQQITNGNGDEWELRTIVTAMWDVRESEDDVTSAFGRPV